MAMDIIKPVKFLVVKSTLRDWIYKYNIESKDFQFTEDGKYIRTHSYSFILT